MGIAANAYRAQGTQAPHAHNGPCVEPARFEPDPPSPQSEAHVDWVGNRGGLAIRGLIAGLRQWDTATDWANALLLVRSPMPRGGSLSQRVVSAILNVLARVVFQTAGLNMGWGVARAHMERFSCTQKFFLFTEGSCIALPVRRIQQAALVGRPVVPGASTPTQWSYLSVISMTWLTKYFDCLVSTLTKT
jgi:hypothetical protein